MHPGENATYNMLATSLDIVIFSMTWYMSPYLNILFYSQDMTTASLDIIQVSLDIVNVALSMVTRSYDMANVSLDMV
jgi:hypothetical protein